MKDADTQSPCCDRELKNFGKHVAMLRRNKGWSQEKLALESGLARSYIGGVERGLRNLSLKNILRLAVALELQASELLEGNGENMSCERPSYTTINQIHDSVVTAGKVPLSRAMAESTSPPWGDSRLLKAAIHETRASYETVTARGPTDTIVNRSMIDAALCPLANKCPLKNRSSV